MQHFLLLKQEHLPERTIQTEHKKVRPENPKSSVDKSLVSRPHRLSHDIKAKVWWACAKSSPKSEVRGLVCSGQETRRCANQTVAFDIALWAGERGRHTGSCEAGAGTGPTLSPYSPLTFDLWTYPIVWGVCGDLLGATGRVKPEET